MFVDPSPSGKSRSYYLQLTFQYNNCICMAIQRKFIHETPGSVQPYKMHEPFESGSRKESDYQILTEEMWEEVIFFFLTFSCSMKMFCALCGHVQLHLNAHASCWTSGSTPWQPCSTNNSQDFEEETVPLQYL